MIYDLGDVQLKSGRWLQRRVVEAPEVSWAATVQGLLAHKGWIYRWHVQRALREPLDGLETRFYVGMLAGEAVATLMLIEARGVGLVGHVNTRPEYRRQGIATALMAAQMEDFQRRAGRLLTLGTGYDSPAYWIYHSFGFRSVAERSGLMWWAGGGEPWLQLWSAPVAGVGSVQWTHWPLLNLLCVQPEGDFLRHLGRHVWGQKSFEGGFLSYKRRLEEEGTGLHACVLENAAGLVVGWASVEDDLRWQGQVALLDLFVHPAADQAAGELLASLELPCKPVLAYAQTGSPKEELLASHSFQRQTVWADWLTSPTGRIGVSLWLRER